MAENETTMTHIKLRKTLLVIIFLLMAGGVTAASIIGRWPWQWVVAGALLGTIVFFQLSKIIYPVKSIARRILAEEEAKKKSAQKGA